MSHVYCPSCHRKSAAGERCDPCDSSLLLQGRWTLQEMLGHGASGYTWKAECDDGEVVAIKELSFRRLTDLKQLELFEREAAALSALEHQGIPDFVEQFVVEEDRFVSAYLVQEYIDGGVLTVGSHTDEEEVLEFLEEMSGVLDHLHSRRPPVIHRDIKPANVMRRGDGSYVLIDFGSIRAAVEATVGGSTVAGTLGYMAPEQLMGRATVASDFFGLGATALAMIAGQEAHNLIEHHRPGSWREKVKISEPVAELIEELLASEAGDRCSTGRELRRRIGEVRAALAAREKRAEYKQERVEQKRSRPALRTSAKKSAKKSAEQSARTLERRQGLGFLESYSEFLNSWERVVVANLVAAVIGLGIVHFFLFPWVIPELWGALAPNGALAFEQLSIVVGFGLLLSMALPHMILTVTYSDIGPGLSVPVSFVAAMMGPAFIASVIAP